MSPALAASRCLNHPERAAAGRCRECTRSFCHECVTEHGGRLTCVACLRAGERPAKAGGIVWRRVAPPLLGFVALVGTWGFFYSFGSWLEWVTTPAAAVKKAP